MFSDELNDPKRLFLPDSFLAAGSFLNENAASIRAARPQTRAFVGYRSEGSGVELEWEIRRVGLAQSP